MSEELLTAKEVAALWRVSPRTIARKVQAQKLVPVRLGGDGALRFKRSDVTPNGQNRTSNAK